MLLPPNTVIKKIQDINIKTELHLVNNKIVQSSVLGQKSLFIYIEFFLKKNKIPGRLTLTIIPQ